MQHRLTVADCTEVATPAKVTMPTTTATTVSTAAAVLKGNCLWGWHGLKCLQLPPVVVAVVVTAVVAVADVA